MQEYNPSFEPINWKNKSDAETTPLGETNLRSYDQIIKLHDNLISEITKEKVDISEIQSVITNISIEENSGNVTITKKDGNTETFYIYNLVPLYRETLKATEDSKEYAKNAKMWAFNAQIDAENSETSAVKSEYYYLQAKSISSELSGILRPKGTISINNLPSLQNSDPGDMYNIIEKFTTTNDFKEGPGISIPAGSNIYKTVDNKWDVLAGVLVTSVNGQTGDVTVNLGNITGVLPVEKGGTGKTTGRDAIDALITFLPGYQNDVTSAEENAYIILQDLRMQNRYLRKPIKALVNYIKSILTSSDVGALPTTGGTMTGNIVTNGKIINDTGKNRQEIDFDSPTSLEIGIREELNKNFWNSYINFNEDVINVESTNIDLIGGGARLKISDRNFNLSNSDNAIYSSNESLYIDSYNNIDLLARNEGHINLYAYDEISFFIPDLSNKHLFNISSSGRFELLAKNGINIESGNESIYIKMPNDYVFEISTARLFRIFSHEYKLYCHPEDFSESHEFFRISKSGKTTFTPPKVLDVQADVVRIGSNGRIDLFPGTSSVGTDPGPNFVVRTGNLEGKRLAGGNKPNISNFGKLFIDEIIMGPDEYKIYQDDDGTNWVLRTEIDCSGISFIRHAENLSNYKVTQQLVQHGPNVNDQNYSIYIYVNGTLRTDYIFSNGFFYTVKGADIGTSAYKWKNIYAQNGTIQTSDRNEKNTIQELTLEQAKKLILGLKLSTYKMNNGTSGRTHWGIISQDLEELLESLGMTSMDFAGFIKSPKVRIITEDENGNPLEEPIEEVVEGEYDYSLRYDEFIAPHIKVTQDHEDRITILEETVQQQSKEIENLKADKAQLEKRLAEIEKRLGII